MLLLRTHPPSYTHRRCPPSLLLDASSAANADCIPDVVFALNNHRCRRTWGESTRAEISARQYGLPYERDRHGLGYPLSGISSLAAYPDPPSGAAAGDVHMGNDSTDIAYTLTLITVTAP
ncbi:hypothetical protein DFH09DRAFT_1317675 [Mycena vulgaris]|nr:hypothetical protein DFH09DRAFT_1317675 [Mycena vulgaris]